MTTGIQGQCSEVRTLNEAKLFFFFSALVLLARPRRSAKPRSGFMMTEDQESTKRGTKLDLVHSGSEEASAQQPVQVEAVVKCQLCCHLSADKCCSDHRQL